MQIRTVKQYIEITDNNCSVHDIYASMKQSSSQFVKGSTCENVCWLICAHTFKYTWNQYEN